MAEKLATPLDPLTRNPLPLRLTEILPSDRPEIANRHHPWHPSDAPVLDTSSLVGNALRNSAIQLVPVEQHNGPKSSKHVLRIHDVYKGPALPDSEDEAFKRLVPASAGHIPDEAIDLNGGEARVVRLTSSDLEILKTPATVQPINRKRMLRLREDALVAYDGLINPTMTQEAYADQFVKGYRDQQMARMGYNLHHFIFGLAPIRDFFRHYVITRDLSHIHEVTIEEFLLTKDLERRKFLGHLLLAKAVEVATEPVSRTYSELHQSGSLPEVMPRSARSLVKYRLGKPKQQEILAVSLGQRLKQRVQLAA